MRTGVLLLQESLVSVSGGGLGRRKFACRYRLCMRVGRLRRRPVWYHPPTGARSGQHEPVGTRQWHTPVWYNIVLGQDGYKKQRRDLLVATKRHTTNKTKKTTRNLFFNNELDCNKMCWMHFHYRGEISTYLSRPSTGRGDSAVGDWADAALSCKEQFISYNTCLSIHKHSVLTINQRWQREN